MQFAAKLRDRVRTGEITQSVRIWKSARVKVGNSYPLSPGRIRVDAVHEIELGDVTPRLARATGFASVPDLLKIAKHGRGERVFLVSFHYETGSP
jgi:hypothetical protein